MLSRRTFIVRCYQADGTVVIEDLLTRDRVRVAAVDQVGAQIERWLDQEPRGEGPIDTGDAAARG